VPVETAADRFFRQILEEGEKETATPSEVVARGEERDKPVTRGNLFTHHDTHPIILDMALIRLFGTDWLEWEPETLREEIQRRYPHGISELNWNQIQAVKTLHVHDAPWQDYEAFVPVILALNNNIPIFTLLQRPTISNLMAGVDMMNDLREEEFTEEISRFCAACFLDEGVVYAPPPLDFIQGDLSKPMYYCPDCGSHVEDLPVDGICDVCSERFADGHPGNFRPNPEVVEKIRQTGEGTNIRTYLERPFKEVKERLADFHSTGHTLQEDVVDIQVAKLVVAENYMAQRRQQLQDQTRTMQPWFGEGA
jgi:hypothetical protein